MGVFSPFKKLIAKAQTAWLRNHPGHTMTIYDISEIVSEAWKDSMTIRNICNDFEKTGIWP